MVLPGSPSPLAVSSATYAMDEETTNQVRSVALDTASGLGLPGSTTGGGNTFDYHDINGAPITGFDAKQVQALYQAMRDYQFGVQKGLQTIVQAGSGSLPPNTVTIP